MVPIDPAFNDKHKKRGIVYTCPASVSAQDLGEFDLEKEKSVVTLKELLEDCIRDTDNSQQLSELAGVLLCMIHIFVINENMIGRGGFADVYKGSLQDGQLIAVKRLNKGTPENRTSSFLSELGILAHVDHPNTAKLIGCGVEGGMHLVFELSPLGNLGSLLHGVHLVPSPNKNKLDWSKRHKIIMGIADGLLYLHEICQRRIIHRDIKGENILLTENFEPQICDFGLAKWLPELCTHRNVSKFEGTMGYLAPEYFMHGIVSEKTDIYSFGVLLLEIITGRHALDHLKQSIVLWAKPLFEANNIKDLVDPSLGDDYDREQMDRVVLTASLCVEQYPILRPSMSQASMQPKTLHYCNHHEK
ncbi:Receptor-like cytosolic serine/threonine-protein kinase RBK2 [Glycine max]|nr:Receptor-like cytosolic serine/threonine-protein kinase RBK2 [Glycine max]